MLTRPPSTETVTRVRPSEAIRLGVLVAPIQAEGRLFDDGGRACALGAMAIGLGLVDPDAAERTRPTDDDLVAAIAARLPARLPHPERFALGPTVQVVVSLNDGFGWSRERIAGWLEGWGW